MAMRERLSARGVLKVSQTQLSDPGKTIIDFYERIQRFVFFLKNLNFENKFESLKFKV